MCVIYLTKDLSVVECIIVKRRMLVKDPQPLFTPLCISQLLSHADFVVSVTLN